MTFLEYVLAGLLIAVVSGTLGSALTSRLKVSEERCMERRTACSRFSNAEFKHIRDQLDSIKSMIRNGNGNGVAKKIV